MYRPSRQVYLSLVGVWSSICQIDVELDSESDGVISWFCHYKGLFWHWWFVTDTSKLGISKKKILYHQTPCPHLLQNPFIIYFKQYFLWICYLSNLQKQTTFCNVSSNYQLLPIDKVSDYSQRDIIKMLFSLHIITVRPK